MMKFSFFFIILSLSMKLQPMHARNILTRAVIQITEPIPGYEHFMRRVNYHDGIYIRPSSVTLSGEIGCLPLLDSLNNGSGQQTDFAWKRLDLAVGYEARAISLYGSDFEAVLKDVLNDWNAASGLKLRSVGIATSADIIISLHSSATESCREPMTDFTYGHAYYPPRGRVHLNSDLMCSSSECLYNVLLHEMGHAIGLFHDESRDSLMYPTLKTSGKYVINKKSRDALAEMYGDLVERPNRHVTGRNSPTMNVTSSSTAKPGVIEIDVRMKQDGTYPVETIKIIENTESYKKVKSKINDVDVNIANKDKRLDGQKTDSSDALDAYYVVSGKKVLNFVKSFLAQLNDKQD